MNQKKNQSFYPLSQGQKALWFLYQTSPKSLAYNIFNTIEIKSSLNIELFKSTWQLIINRHPILRTTYTNYEGEPVQQIQDHKEVNIKILDANSWSNSFLEEQILFEVDRPFDLEKGSIYRIVLFKCNSRKHILLLAMHHIAGDMRSFDILINEFKILYGSETDSDLNKNLDYREYGLWQTELLRSFRGEELEKYWQKKLKYTSKNLEIPIDKPRPLVQTYNGKSHFYKPTEKLILDIQALAKAEKVTVYTILVSALQILLYRYSSQEDIILGIPMDNRTEEQFHQTVGYFANPVVLASNFSEDLIVKELIIQNRLAILEAKTYKAYPFPLLVQKLAPERDLNHSPIFQFSCSSQKQRWCEPVNNSLIEETKLQMEPYILGHQRGAAFDLDMMVIQAGEIIQICWQYNSDLFHATTIARMVEHFQTLLEAIVANPEQKVSQLPLLTAAEQHQLLVAWNDTKIEYPEDAFIHHLFAEQVSRSPSAVAVVFQGEKLTYRELNAKANKLAHYLQKLGVEPEILVGICMERSLEMLVGLLAILKAGGAYVPLDPRYPQERLAHMLEDSQVSVLLSQEKFVAQISEHQAHIVCLDTNWNEIDQESPDEPVSSVKPDNLAYILYTSGSTGKPKGVQICHQSLTNFLNSMRLKPGITDKDTLLAVTTISFDIAALELYLPLIVGAKIVLVSSEVAADGSQLLKLLINSGVTMMQATPATWRMLLAAGWEGTPQLKILCGGEALTKELRERIKHRSASVWNVYGPTETTIWSTIHNVSDQDVERAKDATELIGKPIGNTQIYILDSYLHPVPIGVAGELHIGGVGVARGYLNRSDLTQEKFIPNPFSNDPSSRLYKTGDLTRYLANGNIEYLGRIDNQVKIRGFRIELGEIEAILAQHPSIQTAVVIVWEDTLDKKRLVAYLVANQLPAPSSGELSYFLKQKLPDYMVPSAFVFLETLPLTPNGKINRRALPAPDQQDLEETFVAPQDDLELQLVRIWEKVLGVQPIGIQNNFFELGGHSLLAVHLLAQIEKTFGKNLPLPTLLQAPTVEQLANIIRSQGWSPPKELLVPLKSGNDQPPLFCIYGILLYYPLAHSLNSDRPVYGIYLQEEVDLLKEDKLEQQLTVLSSIPKLAKLYIKQIKTVQPVGPYYLAGESFGGLVAFEMAHQLLEEGEKVDLLAMFDTNAPVNRKRSLSLKRVLLHLENISKEGFTYLLQKGKRRIASTKDKLLNTFDRTFIKLTQAGEQSNFDNIEKFVTKDIRQRVRNQAVENYVVRPYPGKVLLFRAMDKTKLELLDSDSKLGWGEVIVGGLEVHNVPGDHISILKEPNVQVMAAKLRDYLEDTSS
ncbi:MAG TPA: amino acid adenylation domain-containing protein [Oculatellaceae cyanobacterium]|jgi:amino acid adenylation domain-containing protein